MSLGRRANKTRWREGNPPPLLLFFFIRSEVNAPAKAGA